MASQRMKSVMASYLKRWPDLMFPALMLGSAVFGMRVIRPGYRKITEGPKLMAMQNEVRHLEAENRRCQEEHREKMLALAGTSSSNAVKELINDVDSMCWTLGEVWTERIRRYESGIKLFDQYGKALPWLQWHMQHLEKWFDMAAERFEKTRVDGEYGEYEWISARMHSMNIAMPPVAFGYDQRMPDAQLAVKMLRNIADKDPMLMMMEASLSHIDPGSVPHLHAEGSGPSLSLLLERAVRSTEAVSPQAAASVGKYIRRGDDGACLPLRQRDDVKNALSGVMHIHRQLGADKTPGEVNDFVIGAGDWLMTQQAFDSAQAYLQTLQLSLTENRKA